MRLYFRYAAMHVRSAMQYRADFLAMLFGQLFVVGSNFLAIVLLFDRFGSLPGYTFGEVAMCFAVIGLSYVFSDCFCRGFDVFSRLIVRGEFDRLLVRPRTLVLQVLGSDFGAVRGGFRILYNAVIMVVAVIALDTVWTPMRALTVVMMVLGGTGIMSGVFILGATMCFYTVQGLEVINVFTDGGREISSYPLTIYNQWIRRFFTFIVPFGVVNYLPLRYVMGHSDSAALAFLPLVGMLFLIPALAVWYLGARKYVSTGS